MRSRILIAALVIAFVISTWPAEPPAQAGGINTWTSLGPPQHIAAVAVDPQLPLVLFASSNGYGNGSVYKTTTGGQNWFYVAYSALESVRRIAVSPGNSNIVLVSGSGVARSTNGSGFSTTPLPIWETDGLAFAPSSPNVVYAGSTYAPGLSSAGQVFRSTNAGATFNPTTFDGTDGKVNDVAVDPHNEATVYAVGYGSHAIWKSTDSGLHWTAYTAGAPQNGAVSVAADPDYSNILYVGTRHGSPTAPFYRTTTSGGLWMQAGAGLLSTSEVTRVVVDSNGLVYVAMRDGDAVGSKRGGVFRSVDKGVTFADISSGLPSQDNDNSDVFDLALDPQPTGRLYAATGKGVYTVALQADLNVEMSTPLPSVRRLTPTTFTATVRNLTGVAATQVSLKMPKPPADDATAGPFQVSQGSCTSEPNALVCNLGVVQPGASATVAQTFTPTALGMLTVTAAVSGIETDPNTSDNHATAAVRVFLPIPGTLPVLTPTPPLAGDPCVSSGRPQVGVQVTQDGSGTLRAVLSATSTAGVPENRLTQVAFGAGTNAQIEIGDGIWRTGPHTAPVGPASTWTFRVRRVGPGAFTQPLTATDTCGPWPTFVGGGISVP